MIIAFSVENHRSIRERQTLNLEATADDHLSESRIRECGSLRLLRSAAIFGPNASGKSSLINAMMVMRGFVLASAREGQVNEKIPVNPYRLRQGSDMAPSLFEWEFFWKGGRYRYGFTADREAIRSEWLMRKGSGKEAMLFTREGQAIDINPAKFPEGIDRKQFARPNALFLSLCAQLNGEESASILGWFEQLRFASGLSDRSLFTFTAKQIQDAGHAKELAGFARKADFCISALSSELEEATEDNVPKDIPEEHRRQLISRKAVLGAEIKARHTVYDIQGNACGHADFDLDVDESAGTRKFVSLAGPLHHTVQTGSIIVIDEFEARLHPSLTKAIWEWFHSPSNTGTAQLIVPTHEILLMDPDILRRDQIWFFERDNFGATQLSCLAEFDPQKVRSTTKFSRQYLLGIFGAVPKLALDSDAPCPEDLHE